MHRSPLVTRSTTPHSQLAVAPRPAALRQPVRPGPGIVVEERRPPYRGRHRHQYFQVFGQWVARLGERLSFSGLGRSMDRPNLWSEGNTSLYARADESRKDILVGYRSARATADATIEALDVDSPGVVPWWANLPVTLHRMLVT